MTKKDIVLKVSDDSNLKQIDVKEVVQNVDLPNKSITLDWQSDW